MSFEVQQVVAGWQEPSRCLFATPWVDRQATLGRGIQREGLFFRAVAGGEFRIRKEVTETG